MRDRFLMKAMGWQDIKITNSGHMFGTNPIGRINSFCCEGFNTWTGFGILWEWVQKQDWCYKFQGYVNGTYMECFMTQEEPNDWDAASISPETFANKLYEFLLELQTS